jgi:integrase
MLFSRLRGGSAGAARGAASFLTETVSRVRHAGATGPLTVRADSAFYSQAVLLTARKFDVRFSVTVRHNRRIRAAIAAIDEDAWTPIPHWLSSPGVSGADIAETSHTCFAGTQQALTVRLVVRRVRPTSGSQLALFTAWDYHAFVTDRDLPLAEAEADHRRHAVVEQTIAELKSAGLAHPPSGKFMADAAWLALAVLAHNLGRAIGILAGGRLARATATTLRRTLFTMPARLVHSPRRRHLRASERWRWPGGTSSTPRWEPSPPFRDQPDPCPDDRNSERPADRQLSPAHAPMQEKRRRYLTADQLEALADAAGPGRVAVLTLGYCGLRWSELAALRVRHFDLLRRRVLVEEAVTEVDGARLVWGTPRPHGRRSVPLPRFLVDELTRTVVNRPPDQLAFPPPQGAVLRNRNARAAWFDAAARAIGEPGLTPHELRHTAASLAIKAGANVKAVQRRLGHASATMTLDRYADLFDNDLDDVADRLDALRAASRGRSADLLRTDTPFGGPDRAPDGGESAGEAGGDEGNRTLTPALQNRPRGGLAQWAVTENRS